MKNVKSTELKVLSEKEIQNVYGGLGPNAIGAGVGAVNGAIWGFYGAIIAGGQNATGWDMLKGAVGGAITGATAGFFSPISTVSSAIATVATGGAAGAATGAAASLIDDIEAKITKAN